MPASALLSRLAARIGLLTSALALLSACASNPVDPDAPGIITTNTVWYWLGSATLANSVTIADPSLYSLELTGSRVLMRTEAQIRADCNRGTGKSDTSHEGRIWIEKIALSRAMCPPGSQDARYLNDLELLAQAEVRGPVMRVEQTQIGNVSYFSRDPKTRMAVYRCAGTADLPVALINGDTLRLWSAEGFEILTRSPAASGELFVNGGTAFHSKGRDAFVERNGVKVFSDCRQVGDPR
ncbi:META domain-containing protein [Uliginosibacterium sp. H1]|uniref:META domain-containing protein n=1 Tax=Uliginosibacterium sp. H1 TaxID=3114757 RepID=UPI002E190E8D|nr:META domain-containing protein [Uliginosibacterium sp. H1]